MIDPNNINTIRVGQLVEAVFSGTDNIPHEVGTDLRRGTIADLATYIAGVIDASGGLAFLPIAVVDGQELPPTTANEWFLAGKGTYTQTGGYPDIVCDEGLSVIIGNGAFWSLGVSIPIVVDPADAMISQTVNAGVTNYSPSEDAVRTAIDEIAYLNAMGTFHYADLATQTVPISVTSGVEAKLTNDADGVDTNVNNAPFGVSGLWNPSTNQFDFTQLAVGDVVHFRPDLSIDLTGTNTSYKLYMKMAIGGLNPWTLNIHNGERKSTDEFDENIFVGFDIASDETKDFPAEIYILTDAGATVKVNGWYFEIIRKNINLIDVGEIPQSKVTNLITDLASKADDANVVHKTGNETIGGIKKFTNELEFFKGVYVNTLDWPETTSDRVINFPDATGTIALDENVVHLTGNEEIIGDKFFSGSISTDTDVTISGGASLKFNLGTYESSLNSTTLTGSRSYDLPNASGVIALTSDIPVISGTTNYITKFATSSTVGNSQIFDNGTNVCVGTSTDDGFNKFQVNGTGVFKGGDITTGFANMTSTSTFKLKTANPAISLAVGYLASDDVFISSYNSSTNTQKNLYVNPFGGTVNINNLSGAGSRIVVADSNGNLSAEAPTTSAGTYDILTRNTSTGVVEKVSDIRPYKIYVALLSQVGTGAPTAIVLENTLGGIPVWSRGGVGIYTATLTGAFTASKTVVFITNGAINGKNSTGGRFDNNSITVSSSGLTSLEDTAFVDGTIEIRVYN